MNSQKKQKHKKEIIIPEKNQDWLGIILIGLAGLLLFYPPYFQGLFFVPQIFIAHIITAVVFIIVWINKYKHKNLSMFSNL